MRTRPLVSGAGGEILRPRWSPPPHERFASANGRLGPRGRRRDRNDHRALGLDEELALLHGCRITRGGAGRARFGISVLQFVIHAPEVPSSEMAKGHMGGVMASG